MRIAMATSEEFPELEPDSRLLLPALAERGIEVQPGVWSDPEFDWSGWDAIVVRSPWDYFHRPAEWDAWIDTIAGTGLPVWNPPEVLRWNSHKAYLEELGRRGVPVVDTLDLPQGARVDLAAAMEEHGWEDAIFKPAIAGGALGLVRVRSAAEARAAQAELDRQLDAGEVLVQPFLPSIVAEGELSLVYFGGELSHSLVKRAKPGDIRVQPEYGGVPTLTGPTSEAIHVAERVFDAVDADLLYARVDLVRAADGTLRLIELEVIEPRLFLDLDPAAPARFAAALADRLGAA